MAEMAQREAYGRALAAYGEQNRRIFVLDADTSASPSHVWWMWESDWPWQARFLL